MGLVLPHRSDAPVRLFVEQVPQLQGTSSYSITSALFGPHFHEIFKVLAFELFRGIIEHVGNFTQMLITGVDP